MPPIVPDGQIAQVVKSLANVQSSNLRVGDVYKEC